MTDRQSVRFAVRLTPRAGRDEVVGVGADGELLVKVRAAPVDGAANEALTRLLAGLLDVPHSSVAVVRGSSSRHKMVSIGGVSRAAIEARWRDVQTS